MKFINIFLVVCIPFGFVAQISLPDSYLERTTGTLIRFDASYDAQASALQNQFFNTLLRGGELSSEQIDQTFAKQKKNNVLGRNFSSELSYAPLKLKFFKSENLSWLFESSFQSFLAANYSADFFGLGFLGNQSYVGDTANFDGLALKQMNWQSLGAGFIHKKTKSYLSINLVNVSQVNEGELSKASIYTSADSSLIDFNLKGSFKQSYSGNFVQGIGLSTNFAYNVLTPRQGEESLIFQLAVRNLGVVYMPDVKTYEVDTSVAFQGFRFMDLIAASQTDFSQTNWYDTLRVDVDTIAKWTMLPVSIQLAKLINPKLAQPVQAFFGIKAYPLITYFPKLYAGADWKIKDQMHLGASCSYGGFGGFRAGVYANYTTEKLYIGVGTEDVYGLFAQAGYGKMFNLRILCAF